MLICRGCGISKEPSDFSPDKRKKNGLQARCKICTNKWQKENPEYGQRWFFQKKYGITIDQFQQMLLTQNGVCACCNLPEWRTDKRTGKLRALCVDHDHETGRVRALLCDDCNVAVGRIKEEPSRAMLLYKYLQEQANQ